ncbi:response regulator [Mucilaginibacter sp. OK098]|uniref:hybrid sensor histidine kinase/response regulator n=1 Tax=Mucilaginibacter sp. OK098 TaxID=1855297 RepID=UPI0009132C19|nr:response regulator [Mucilaginibacter sp. OK098]SHM96588.1 PAS domain S-box-containing protein [Mucilaginibacter sp. OK098]
MIPINILIVDDREENIIALRALLERDDIKIFSTTSPNEGLKLAWENQISIALVDVQMPEMNGFEFVEMLKSNARTRDILVIFVTAISKETKYAVRGLGTGAVDYLYKPLDPYITSAKVDSFIQLARYQADIKKKNLELENFAVIVKNSADIICVVDAHDFRIQTINPASEKIIGSKPATLIGKSIIDFAVEHQRSAFRIKLGEIIKDNISTSVFEFQFNTFSKRIIWAECRVAYQNKALFFNISDVSAQKSYQNQLIKSKENAEYGKKVKEIFLANMSHELRTPINGIIGLTALLHKTELNEQQNGMINLLEVSSQSLLGVINDVLDISKMEAGKFSIVRSPNNLHDLVKSVYGLLKFKADESNIEFLLEIAPDVPVNIMVDSLRLNQILMNLLSNAIKFTERGYVILKISVLEKDANQVKLQFIIEDSGIGISPDRLTNVFEAFEQADDSTASKYGGTGLGLAIVKKLVELKGGEITVKSETGKGSAFTFVNLYMLAAKPKEKAVIEDVKPPVELFENISVLVAEDNVVNQFMLSKMLKDWSMDVDIVDNGRKVLDKLQAKNYDLILMDTHMPELNGYETARSIRINFEEPKRSIPIISLSAAAFDYEQQEAIAAGMNDLLSKPFQPHELHGKIKSLLAPKELVKS